MDVHPAHGWGTDRQPSARVTEGDLSSFGAGTGDGEASARFPGHRVKYRDPVLRGEHRQRLSVRSEQPRLDGFLAGAWQERERFSFTQGILNRRQALLS